MGSGGGPGPGSSAEDSIIEWRKKFREAGSPSFGYECPNDFEAWLICRIEEAQRQSEDAKILATAVNHGWIWYSMKGFTDQHFWHLKKIDGQRTYSYHIPMTGPIPELTNEIRKKIQETIDNKKENDL